VRQQQQGGTRYAVAGAGLVIRVIAILPPEAHWFNNLNPKQFSDVSPRSFARVDHE